MWLLYNVGLLERMSGQGLQVCSTQLEGEVNQECPEYNVQNFSHWIISIGRDRIGIDSLLIIAVS